MNDIVFKIIDKVQYKLSHAYKDKEDSEFYNIPYLEKIDKAYDNKHIGTLTNQEISKFVLEKL